MFMLYLVTAVVRGVVGIRICGVRAPVTAEASIHSTMMRMNYGRVSHTAPGVPVVDTSVPIIAIMQVVMVAPTAEVAEVLLNIMM